MPPDPTDPRAGELARAKMALTIALVAIGLSTVVALFFLRSYSLPLRLFIVAGDLIAMAALWLIVRQKFSGK
jgi:protein-S-isoprenylcysteine O-methyltransferase Ste14